MVIIAKNATFAIMKADSADTKYRHPHPISTRSDNAETRKLKTYMTQLITLLTH
jgi:hypothetical protein